VRAASPQPYPMTLKKVRHKEEVIRDVVFCLHGLDALVGAGVRPLNSGAYR